MIELYNALTIITLPFFIQKILTFNLGVAFLKSVSIEVLGLTHDHFWVVAIANDNLNVYT